MSCLLAPQSVPYESSSSVQDKRQMVKQCLLKALSDTVSVYHYVTKARRSCHFRRIIEQIHIHADQEKQTSECQGQRDGTVIRVQKLFSCWVSSLALLVKLVKKTVVDQQVFSAGQRNRKTNKKKRLDSCIWQMLYSMAFFFK